MDRQNIFGYAKKKYGSKPEYLWKSYPSYAVLRHSQNNKWYAVVMNVSGSRLGLDFDEEADIMNVKADALMIGSLRSVKGILPGYHMNKNNWISVLLDGSVDEDMIYALLDESYKLTGRKR